MIDQLPRIEPTGSGAIEWHDRNSWGERLVKRYSIDELRHLIPVWEKSPETFGISADTLNEFRAALSLELEITRNPQ